MKHGKMLFSICFAAVIAICLFALPTQAEAALEAESASFISRNDGVWLWPTTRYAVSDWAGCNASQNVNSYCYFCGVQHGLCGANHLTTLGHNGVDIPVGLNSNVYAAAAGTLYCTNADWPYRGITAVVEHPVAGTGWSYYSIYQHLSSTAISKNGANVAAGEVIAWSGNTDGFGTGQAHLHFGIVMAASGQGSAMAQNPNSVISAVENCGWITTTGYKAGRILVNPALNSPAGTPEYTDGCMTNVRNHAGSIMYTQNLAEVSIGADAVPVYAFDVAFGGVGQVSVHGWAFDPDTLEQSVEIEVYVNDVYRGSGIANTYRWDVNDVYGCGDYHGFDVVVSVPVSKTGTCTVKAIALNTNPDGNDAIMGEKTVTIEISSGWYLKDNYWHYGRNGQNVTGWLQDCGAWYYMNAEGVMQTGWQQIGGVWYYFNASGAMVTGWLRSGNMWYYMNSSGAMVTGWQNVGGTWYYFNSSGAMQTGWVKSGNTWYYLNSSGAMATGWCKVGSTYYYFASSGAMKTGWVKDGNTWYYMNTSGAMVTGWLKLGNIWYYFKSSGAMVTGSLKIGAKTYNFNSSGACLNP